MRRKLLIFVFLFVAAFPSRAQFFLNGEDPGHLRWYSVDTPYYKIIYPEGADSLARNYGLLLEQFRPAIGLSLGYTPGEGQLRMPVVLHTHNPYSNGSVAWAPRQMNLYTVPEPYGSDPNPWDLQLVAHEPRHQAQLELDRHGFWRFPSFLLGQIWDPLLFQAYFGLCLAEGDAVTVETGLTKGSRARTADFLNYYRVALDQGDYRNWYRWRYGSFKYYTPDHYKLGYITVAGSRVLTNDPLIMGNALEKSRRNRFVFNTLNIRNVVKDRTGLRFKEAFPRILDTFNDVWQADAAARTPFMSMERISPKESFPVEYSTPAELNGVVYLLRSGYVRTKELGYLEGDRFHRIRHFASHTSSLFPDPVFGRIYWSETIGHPRWDLAGKSIIRYYVPSTGEVFDLTKSGRMYNPQPSPDGLRLSVVEYPVNGGTAVLILDAFDGSIVRRHIAPDGIQVCESAWVGETVYVSGVSVDGFGIYRIDPDGSWNTELAPSIQKLVNMGADGDCLQWVSDLSGVNELYSYNTVSKELLQITASRYGATDFCFVGKELLGVSQVLDGMMLFRTPADSLQPRQACYSKEHVYPIEDRITAQECSFRAQAPDSVSLSAPRRYSKIGHIMRLHSWAPVFYDYDETASLSMDYLFNTASPGATGYFQSTLGTMSGMLGFAFRPEGSWGSVWRPSVHARIRYSGWYPVIEASVDYGDRMSMIMAKAGIRDNMVTQYAIASGRRDKLMVAGSVKAYIPLRFSKGGIIYGIIPQVNYNITNYLFDRNFRYADAVHDPVTDEISYEWEKGHVPDYIPMQRLSGSARAYLMLPKAESAVYPRWGVGLEGGFNMRPGMAQAIRPNAYAYLYGYVPGFVRQQGLRLTGMLQHQVEIPSSNPLDANLQKGELATNTLPRGFSSDAGTVIGRNCPWQLKLTADYAIPIYVGDIALPPIAYIRNFLLVPHYDFSFLGAGYNLWSAGADITAEFGKLLLPFDCSAGVSISYLGGNAFGPSGQDRRWSFEFIMSYDF